MYLCYSCHAWIPDEELIKELDGTLMCPSCCSDDISKCHPPIARPAPSPRHYDRLPSVIRRDDGARCWIVIDPAREISGVCTDAAGDGRDCVITLGKDWLSISPAARDFMLHHEAAHFVLYHIQDKHDRCNAKSYAIMENEADCHAAACGCDPRDFLAHIVAFTPHVRGKWNQKNHAERIALFRKTIGG